MSKERTTVHSFKDVKRNPGLRWRVLAASGDYIQYLLNLEDEVRAARKQLRKLLRHIGKSTLENAPNAEDILQANTLGEDVERLQSTAARQREHMHTAMRNVLIEILPPGTMDQIPEKDLERFFGSLEQAAAMLMINEGYGEIYQE